MAGKIKTGLLQALMSKIEKLTLSLEKANIAQYIELYQNPRRLLYLNFLAGVGRGFGLAMGFTLIGALFLYALGRIAALNLPFVGEMIAEITRIVQHELARRP